MAFLRLFCLLLMANQYERLMSWVLQIVRIRKQTNKVQGKRYIDTNTSQVGWGNTRATIRVYILELPCWNLWCSAEFANKGPCAKRHILRGTIHFGETIEFIYVLSFEIKKIYLLFVWTDIPGYLFKLHQVPYLSRSIKTRYNADVSEANFGIHILLYVELLNFMLINLQMQFKTLSL